MPTISQKGDPSKFAGRKQNESFVKKGARKMDAIRRKRRKAFAKGVKKFLGFEDE